MGTKVYTEKMHEFLASYIPGHSDREVARVFNARFRLVKVTPKAINSYKSNHGLKSGTHGGSPKGESDLWPKNIRKWLSDHNEGKTAAEMTALLNGRFGRSYTVDQIKSMRNRMHLDSGLTGRFEKGHVSHNKGKKGWWPAGCEKGWFKKGQRSWNKCRVGTERWTTDGYLKVKVAQPNVWEFKHILTWERHRGPVPEGCMISFKDGNHANCRISNLMCLKRSEHSCMNHMGLRSSDPKLTEAGLNLVRLTQKIKRVKEGK